MVKNLCFHCQGHGTMPEVISGMQHSALKKKTHTQNKKPLKS